MMEEKNHLANIVFVTKKVFPDLFCKIRNISVNKKC